MGQGRRLNQIRDIEDFVFITMLGIVIVIIIIVVINIFNN